MGKKGVLLDNGKKAQSSMALYWKYNKEKSKQPRQKKEIQKTPEEEMEDRASNNFQKWKQHKQKMITKAYIKPTTTQQVKQSKKESESQQQVYEKIDEKPKQINIPGYGSKQMLAKKLKTQKVPEVNQDTNVLKLPPQYSDLTQDDIIQMLRAKKSKRNFEKRNHEKQEEQDIILGADLFQRKIPDKKKDEEKPQEKIQPVEEIPKQQKFFKSDYLNMISEGMSLKMLKQNTVKESKEVIPQPKVIQQAEQIQEQGQKPQKVVVVSQRFLPKALRK